MKPWVLSPTPQNIMVKRKDDFEFEKT
jgi:hypothetical protein